MKTLFILVVLVVGIDKEALGFRCESTMDEAPPAKSKTQLRKETEAFRKRNSHAQGPVRSRCTR